MTGPLVSDKHVTWAHTPAHIAALKRLGWKIAPQRSSHHAHHAILMIWDRDGEPKMPEEK